MDAEGELCSEARDDEGTARGSVGLGLSFAMLGAEECLLVAFAGFCIASWKLWISSCNERIGSISSELPGSRGEATQKLYAL